jgi:DNA-binding MarR family transcriptional regulator
VTKNFFESNTETVASRVAHGLNKIGTAMKGQAWRHAGPRGLTPAQGQILAFLRSRPVQPQTLGAVAESLAVTPASASDAVSTLVAKKLVRKRKVGRSVAIDLTPAGVREAGITASWPDFLLAGIEALEPVEQEVVLKGIMKMILHLQDRGQIPLSRMCVTCRYFCPNAHKESRKPHHCALVDAPFGDVHLRMDCPEQQPAAEAQASAAAKGWLK